MDNLGGKTVLLTGAARGIGAATARRLTARGAQLALIDLDGAGLEKLRPDLGEGAWVQEVDVSEASAVEAFADETAHRFGGIDVAVANAAINHIVPVQQTDPADFRRVVEVPSRDLPHLAVCPSTPRGAERLHPVRELWIRPGARAVPGRLQRIEGGGPCPRQYPAPGGGRPRRGRGSGVLQRHRHGDRPKVRRPPPDGPASDRALHEAAPRRGGSRGHRSRDRAAVPESLLPSAGPSPIRGARVHAAPGGPLGRPSTSEGKPGALKPEALRRRPPARSRLRGTPRTGPAPRRTSARTPRSASRRSATRHPPTGRRR